MRSAQSTLRSPEAIQANRRHAHVVMSEADLHEGDPRQQHRDEQEHRGDELGEARAGRRRLLRVLIGMRVRVHDGHRRGGRCVAAGVIVVRRRRPAGEARMRADERDQPRDDEAEQRQKDDGLIHRDQPFMRLMSSTAIEPRLR